MHLEMEGAGLPAFKGTAFKNPNFAMYAEACGAQGFRVTQPKELRDAVAEALAAEAARRGQTADELAAALLAEQLPKVPRRRLAFAAVGASTSGRGAAEADEMLAEGFGRD